MTGNNDKQGAPALSHAVVRDLLPSYVEGLTSPETGEAVAAHLAGCEDCRAAYEAMKEDDLAPAADAEPEAGVRYLKKVKRRQAIVLLTVLAVVAGIVAVIAIAIKNPTVLPMPVNGVVEHEVWRLENGDLYFRLTFDEAYPIVSSDSRNMKMDGELRQVWFFGYVERPEFYFEFMTGATSMRLDLDGPEDPVDVLMVAQEGTDEVLTLWREGDEVPDAPPGIEVEAAHLEVGGSTWYRYGMEAERAQAMPVRGCLLTSPASLW